jgi:DNA anti-recombination protein RmuC
MANGIIDLRSKKATTNNSNSLGSKNITDHTQLINRNLPDQHPISAISGLQDCLAAVDQVVNDAKQELQNTTQTIQNDINISFANMQAALQDDVEQVKEDAATRLADLHANVINPSLKNLAARLEAANSQTNSNLTELTTTFNTKVLELGCASRFLE